MRVHQSLMLLSAALAHAQSLNSGKRTPLRFARRVFPIANTSAIPTTTVVTADDNGSGFPGDDQSGHTILPQSPPVDSTSDIVSSNPGPIRTLPPKFPMPSTPPFTYDFSNSSTSIFTNTSTESPTCTGSVTYYGTIPPTVYITVTEGFEVTVTASNASATDSETLITPLPACSATIMPFAKSFAPAIPDPTASPVAGQGPPGFGPPGISPEQASKAPGRPNPAVPPGTMTAQPNAPLATPAATPAASTAVYSSVDYTSTVIVTKKTPVTIISPPTSSPAVDFQSPPPIPPAGGSNPPPNGGGRDPAGPPGGSNNGPPFHPPGNPQGPPRNPQGPPGNPPASPTQSEGVQDQPPARIAGSPTDQSDVTPTPPGLGSIIESIINSPFVPPSRPSRGPVLPFTTIVDSVPIVILPSSVVIGSQTVEIPTLDPSIVEANGATFTVRPSEIVAPARTITLSPLQQHMVTPAPTATVVTTVGGLTFTVGPTVAIFSGTTYRIGEGAPATTITVDGTRVSLGSAGIGLPSTTIVPGELTPDPYAVYTVGDLTFSLDISEALISGASFRIGHNAPEVTTTIGTESVSFGPGGVGLQSTTIAPLTASSSSPETRSRSTSAIASATESAGSENAALSRMRVPFYELLGWSLMALPIGWMIL